MSKAWSIVPALDVRSLDEALPLLRALGDHPFVHGFKVGFSLGLSEGLPAVAAAVRAHGGKPLIYDHQKAATDIPDTGRLFAETMERAGVDEVILFPQAGPATERAWIEALQARGRKVIVGAAMTHAAYLAGEGGFLLDEAPVRMFRLAAELGVRSFVIPLTKPEIAQAAALGAGLPADAEFYSPGYGAQGGDPARFPFARRHHLIAGRSLLAAADPRAWVERARAELEGLA